VTNQARARRVAQGERIAELRRRAHLSQQHAAEKVGVSVRAFADWEHARSNPNGTNLVKLAEVLNTNPDYIEYGVARQPTPAAMGAWAVEKRLLLIEERLATLDQLSAAQTDMAAKLDKLIRLLATHDAIALLTEFLTARRADPLTEFLTGRADPEADDPPAAQAGAAAGRRRRRPASTD
jgi:transcriptional regulator with XRE-family HTH domain